MHCPDFDPKISTGTSKSGWVLLNLDLENMVPVVFDDVRCVGYHLSLVRV